MAPMGSKATKRVMGIAAGRGQMILKAETRLARDTPEGQPEQAEQDPRRRAAQSPT
ncbi:MAG: hypothetical protein ACI8QS_000181 [Planctomycetota bacterium]|jgi:hypothetical protein